MVKKLMRPAVVILEKLAEALATLDG